MVLRIPEAGLPVESSAREAEASRFPTQAFAVTLEDSIIESMIACVQDGEDITLSLGDNPSILYGSSTHHVQPYQSSPSYDLFLTDQNDDNDDDGSILRNVPGALTSLNHKPKLQMRKETVKATRPKEKQAARPSRPVAKGPDNTGLDADIEALENSFAQREAAKLEKSTKVINKPPPTTRRIDTFITTKKLAPSSKTSTYISQSRAESPALSGAGSPALTPNGSTPQSALEDAKRIRSPIIHELAFREQTYDNLWQKYPGDSEQTFKVALTKVAELDNSTQNFVLKKAYWKELDVWNHDYASDEERQQAIDNAVKAYDRMRVTSSDKLWQKLLPREERGKGKVLSKLAKLPQVLNSAPPPPKIQVQHAEDSDQGSSESKNGAEDNNATGGEAMARSSSQQSTTKRKISAREAQEKRLLSNKKKAVATTPKVSPTKSAAKATPASTEKPGKYKSKEFISDSDSDSSDSSAPLAAKTAARAKAAKKSLEKTTQSPAEPPKPKSQAKPPVQAETKAQAKPKAPVNKEAAQSDVKPKPASKPAAKPAAKPTAKRPRDEEEDSSSSTTPLSKRLKPGQAKAAPVVRAPKQQRASDASQASRGTSSGVSLNNNNNKSKNTSPTKSSPLASSPPTNASDLDPAEENAHISTKKRKADQEDGPVSKRPRLDDHILRQARKFKSFYDQYETLHREMEQLDTIPKDKLADLLEMRERLQRMKTEIYEEVPRDRR